jgi:hypothetical protein
MSQTTFDVVLVGAGVGSVCCAGELALRGLSPLLIAETNEVCSTLRPVTRYCRVDASGVPAEWVEAARATQGQPTIVYFLNEYGADALEEGRQSAGELAVATGARVLTVACSAQGKPDDAGAVERGVIAYAWLLGEGCDLDRTAFAHDLTGSSLLEAVLVRARNQGMPVPARSIWPFARFSGGGPSDQGCADTGW